MYVPHIIVGGGIAGLYIACQLHAKKQDFILLEASKRGRNKLVSIKEGDVTFELGASVFHINQTRLLTFLEHLGLSNKVQKMKKHNAHYVYHTYSSESIEKKYKAFFQKAQQFSLRRGMNLDTVEENAMKCLSSSEFSFLKTCWNCWYENANMNAYTFYQQEMPDRTFYHLEGGLSQICKLAMEKCKANIYMEHKVNSIQYDGNVYELTIHTPYSSYQEQPILFMCRNLYVCVSLDELAYISFGETLAPKVTMYRELAHTESSMRFFIILNREIRIDSQIIGEVWFKWLIRISPTIYMIYADNELANSLHKWSDETIVDKWMLYINMTYGYNLKQPKDLKRVIRAYWPYAYTVLNKQFFTEHGNKVRENLPFVCTALPHPHNQAYMEGHLYDI